MEPEPRSNQRLRAYFRPVRIPNFLDRVDHVSLRHSAAWLGFICRHNLKNSPPHLPTRFRYRMSRDRVGKR